MYSLHTRTTVITIIIYSLEILVMNFTTPLYTGTMPLDERRSSCRLLWGQIRTRRQGNSCICISRISLENNHNLKIAKRSQVIIVWRPSGNWIPLTKVKVYDKTEPLHSDSDSNSNFSTKPADCLWQKNIIWVFTRIWGKFKLEPRFSSW